MKHRAKPLLAAIVLVALFPGCSNDAGHPAAPMTATEIPQGAATVSYTVLEEVTTQISAIVDRRRLVIRDASAWEAFWDDLAARIEPWPDPPAIDFATHMVIAATMGQRTSGGFVISVEEVAEKDGTLYAKVQEVTPGVLCITTDVITAPAVAVLVPRHSGPVAFVDKELALPCAP